MIIRNKLFAALAVGGSIVAFAASAAAAQDTSHSSTVAKNSAVSKDDAISDIVVTARRRQERLMDVPTAISVVSAETMKAKGIVVPTDLIHAVPSLQQSSSGFGNSTPHFVIRGQRQQLEFLQSDQSVGIYVDDVAVPRQQGLNAGLFDIANIQVLKGPQGTLFGKNQTAGAILFTSETPKTDFGGFTSVTLGNYNAKRFEGAINVPLTEDLQVRVAGLVNRRDGYIHNVTDNRGYNDQHTDGWRVSTHYAPSSLPIESWLIVNGSNENEIGPITKQLASRVGLPGVGTSALFTAFGNPAGDALASAAIKAQARSYGEWESGGVSQYQLPNGDNVRVKTFAVTNKTELHVGDNVTLRNILGYRYLNSYTSANIGGTAGFLFQPGTTATTATAARLVNPVDANGVPIPAGNIVCGPQSGFNCVVGGAFNSMGFTLDRQVSEEFDLLGKAFDNKLDYIIGGYYFREHGTVVTSNFVPIANGARMGTAQNQPANESKAIFGQLTYHVLSNVSITGGLRQTYDHRVTNARSVNIIPDYFPFSGGLIPADGVLGTCSLVGNSGTLPNNTATNPNNCLLSASKNFHKLTYTASIDWHPVKDILLYFTSRKGYRSGGFNQSATVNTTAQPTVLTPFQPETVTDYEIGFKSSHRFENGMSAGLNIAAYMDKYNNIQRALTSLAGNKSVTVNAADATIKGVEIEARFEPTRWLEFSGYYSFVDAAFDNFVVAPNGLYRDVGDFTKSKFSGVPRNSGGATVTLHTELSGNRGKISAGMDYYGQSQTYLQDNNFVSATQTYILADQIPGYWLLGANVAWLGVMGKPFDLSFNIRNIKNKQYYNGGVDGSTSGIGTQTFFVGEPRTYTFNITYHF